METVLIRSNKMVEVFPGISVNESLCPYLLWETVGWPPTHRPFLSDIGLDADSVFKGVSAVCVSEDVGYPVIRNCRVLIRISAQAANVRIELG